MSLRTIGSTLQAKASPGSRTREQEEFARSKPAIPGKGEVGTVSRGMIEEPLERQVSPGSAKMVSAQPTIEGTTVQPMMPPSPLTEGVGLPATPQPLRSGAAGQALFQGSVPTPQAQSVSGGALAGARPATGYAPKPIETPMGGRTQGMETRVQGEAPLRSTGQNAPTTSGTFGTRVQAGEGDTGFNPGASFQQSGLANLIEKITGGQSAVSRAAAKYQPIGGLVRAGLPLTSGMVAQNIGQGLRSNLQENLKKAGGFLRSLFRR